MEMAALVPISTASSENTPEDDSRIEALLTEQLMQGHVLLEAGCPSCNTPLIKARPPLLSPPLSPSSQPLHELHSIGSVEGNTKTNSNSNSILNANSSAIRPFVIPSHSFETPFTPLPGIPFCVACHAHVVMTEDNVKVLEGCDTLKDKGLIFVALLEPSLTMDTQEEAAAAVERIAARIQSHYNQPLPLIVTTNTATIQTDTPTTATTTTAAVTTTETTTVVTTDKTVTANHPLELFCGSTLSRQVPVSSPREALEAADRVLTQCGVGHSSAMFDNCEDDDEEQGEIEEEGVEAGLEDYSFTVTMNEISTAEVEDQLSDHDNVPPNGDTTTDADPTDAGPTDAATPDADPTDADPTDAATSDADALDAATFDADAPDAATSDADAPDANPTFADDHGANPTFTDADAATTHDADVHDAVVSFGDANDDLNVDEMEPPPPPPPPPPPLREVSTEPVDNVPREEEKKEDEEEDGLGDYSVRYVHTVCTCVIVPLAFPSNIPLTHHCHDNL